jgi:hypothetical protein
MNDETVPPAVQLAAAGMIIDRGYGKAKVEVSVESEGRSVAEMLTALWEAKHAAAAQERAGGDQEG